MPPLLFFSHFMSACFVFFSFLPPILIQSIQRAFLLPLYPSHSSCVKVLYPWILFGNALMHSASRLIFVTFHDCFSIQTSPCFYCFSVHLPAFAPQGFFGRPLRGRFSTVLLRRYLTMMLCTVDLGILSSCPMAPSDFPSFQRSTTRCRCTTSCSLVFWQTLAAVGPPVAPPAAPPVAPAAAAASVGADKRQTVVEAWRREKDNVTLNWSL